MKLKKTVLFLVILILSINSYTALAAPREKADITNYLQDMIYSSTPFFEIDMSFINENEISVSGKAAPRSTIHIYDITDLEYNFQDGQVLSESEIDEVITEGIFTNSFNTGTLKVFDTTIIPVFNRQRYVFVAINYDLKGRVLMGRTIILNR